MIKVLLLLTGGAIGTLFRYAVSIWIQRITPNTFPFGILTVNVLGSFLIGLCWCMAEDFNISAHTRLFLFTGLFGGFTTFSSFSLDTMVLMKIGDYKLALFNILANNILGLIAVFLGYIVGKQLLTFLK